MTRQTHVFRGPGTKRWKIKVAFGGALGKKSAKIFI